MVFYVNVNAMPASLKPFLPPSGILILLRILMCSKRFREEQLSLYHPFPPYLMKLGLLN